jgi:hypothetical protein
MLLLLRVGSFAQNTLTITKQPTNQTVLAGASLSFTVGVSGTGPFTYQWRLNGTNLPNIMSVAGNGRRGYSGDGGLAINAELAYPAGVAVDGLGNLFIVDELNNVIRKVGTDGVIITVAGTGAFGYFGDGEQATNAEFRFDNRFDLGADFPSGYDPPGVAVDSSGNLFIADQINFRIRKVGTSGIITTVAGNGNYGYSGDGGAAIFAALGLATGVAVDGVGNLFIVEQGDNRIREVGTNGIITTVAGNGTNGFWGDGGTATNAELYGPTGVAVDGLGNLFIADSNNGRIRKVTTNGIITTVAGNGACCDSGDGGAATNAALAYPSAVALDGFGNLFIVQGFNDSVREVDTNGVITTVAGNGTPGSSGAGIAATNSGLSLPQGVTLDGLGNIFIADSGNSNIRKVVLPRVPTLVLNNAGANNAGNYDVVVTSPSGSVTSSVAVLMVHVPADIIQPPTNQAALVGSSATFRVLAAGTVPLSYQWYFEGATLAGQTNSALQLANVGLGDAGDYRVVVTNLYGSTSSEAGLVVGYAPMITLQPTNQTVLAGSNPAFTAGVSGTGPFTYQWQFNGTNLPSIIITVAGNGGIGYAGDGAAAIDAELDHPTAVAVDGSGNLFIADEFNDRVRKVGTGGIITTIAGGVANGYSGDGGVATNAGLANPTAVTADGLGDLFIADGNRIRKVDLNGVITTVSGNGLYGYSGDAGAATNAWLANPMGLAVDGFGDLFMADFGNNRIREVDTNGIITTVAGSDGGGVSGDGGAATSALLSGPNGVAVDGLGNLFIVDSNNNRVREVDTNGIIRTVAGNGLHGYSGDSGAATNTSLANPTGVAVDGLGNVFIAENGNARIRKVDINGVISTVAGNGTNGYSGDGGAATNAELSLGIGLAVDGLGNLLVADSGSSRIRKVILPQLPTLVLNNVGSSNAGNYEVMVTSPFGSITSSVASLTVHSPPTITQPPTNQAVPFGGNATLSVAAEGTMPLSYQWYYDGAALAGQTRTALVLTNVGLTSAGDYQVVATNMYGSATSSVAGLAVGYAPMITRQPTNQTVLAGVNLMFAVGVSGSGPFTYQWQRDGTNVPNIISVAGNGTYGYSGDGGPATNAGLSLPNGLAVDGLGNLFIADQSNDRIRKVGTDGIITTLAGNGSYGYSGDGGPASSSALANPRAVAADGLGNLFIADSGNNRIRQVHTNGIITTVAGNGSYGYSGDGGPASSAAVEQPEAVAVDGLGNLFIADTGNNRIRQVRSNGVITTVAGNGLYGYSGDGGWATNAEFNNPFSVAVDGLGNLFIVDSNNERVRKVDTNGIITTVAGNGLYGYSGDAGAATNAWLANPTGVAVDGLGNVFIADNGNARIRKVDLNGVITTVAGNGTNGFSGDGVEAINAELYGPTGVAVDSLGILFIADSNNRRIRKVTLPEAPTLAINNAGANHTGNYQVVVTSPFGSVTSSVAVLTVLLPPFITQAPTNQAALIGSSASFYILATGTSPLRYQWYFDGTALTGQTNSALELASVGLGDAGAYQVVVTNLYGSATSSVASLAVGYAPAITNQPTSQNVLVGGNSTFTVGVSGTGPFTFQWQFDGTSLPNIITVAGNGSYSYSGDGGWATNAEFNNPFSVAVDGLGNLFIADPPNNRIREVGTNGVIITVAGNGSYGYSGDGGPASSAALDNPHAVAADGLGNLFIADSGNNRIRQVDTNGIITTVAGDGTYAYSGDGGPASSAALANPNYVAVDGVGNLFITDTSNNRIREVGTNGIISTVAGNGAFGYSGDGGWATNAALSNLLAVTVNGVGNLFIADASRIREVGTNGVITTVAGNGTIGYSGDGGWATNAELNNPAGLVTDHSGNLFVADGSNNRIRKVDTVGLISTVAGNGANGFSGDGGAATNAELSNPAGLAIDGLGNLLVADTGNSRIRKVYLAQSPTLTLNNARTNNSGNYDVVVTSPFGSATSSVATLTVITSDALQILPLKGFDSTGYEGGPFSNTNGSFALTNPGAGSLSWALAVDASWLEASPKSGMLAASGNATVTVDLNTTAYSLAPGTYSATLLFSNLNDGIVQSRQFNLRASEGFEITPVEGIFWTGPSGGPFNITNQTYRLSNLSAMALNWGLMNTSMWLSASAGGALAAGASDAFTLTPTPAAYTLPAGIYEATLLFTNRSDGTIQARQLILATTAGITNQPATQVVWAGVNVTFSVGVSGGDNDNYQWLFNGTNVPGLITTVAGKGSNFTIANSGDGGRATNASLAYPSSVALDSSGELFIAESGSNRVRKVSTTGIISTVAGYGGPIGFSGDGGLATKAQFTFPEGIAVDLSGDLFISDTFNNRIRRVGTNGIITTFAGSGSGAASQGFFGDGGPATNALMSAPRGIVLDRAGALFIADSGNGRIRKVDASGIITTVAGNLNSPWAVATYGSSNLFIAESGGVLKVGADGLISTVAGTAELSGPMGVSVDGSGNLFIADSGNNRVLEVDTNGLITTVAGNGTRGYAGDGGSATSAELGYPGGLAVDGSGNLFIADVFNNRIRKVINNHLPTLTLGAVAAANAGYYQVIVAASGGSVTSSVAALTVTTVPLIFRAVHNADGSLTLDFVSPPKSTNVVLSTTNLSPLVPWQSLSTNVAGPNGDWQFIDTNTAVSAVRFYRSKTISGP